MPPNKEKKNDESADRKLNLPAPNISAIFPASSAHTNDIIKVPIKPTTRYTKAIIFKINAISERAGYFKGGL